MFVTDSYIANHIFVVYVTFTFKTTDVQANNVKHLRCVAETLLRLARSPEVSGLHAFKQLLQLLQNV